MNRVNDVLAYLDPGSGSLLLQALVGVLPARPSWRGSTGAGPSGSFALSATSRPPTSAVPVGGSFRDPDARVFESGGEILRGLTADGLADWQALVDSDVLTRLAAAGDVIDTARAEPTVLDTLRSLDPEGDWVAALRHDRVPFVSYPYEWTFSMLKDAALLQLKVTREAFSADLALKDATPYNVQWRGTRPVFIDVGSFARAREGEPWLGYRQFCMLFLFPLLLEAYKGIPFQPWLRGSLEGIHPSEARALLRGRHSLRSAVLRHVVLHAKLARRHADGAKDVRRELREAGFDKRLVEANLRGLEKLVTGLSPPDEVTEWSEYGATCSYSNADTQAKEAFVRAAVHERPRTLVWDLGANDGRYSRIASEGSAYTLAVDADRGVVDRLFRALRVERSSTILPLLGDIADPSPGLGWRGRERSTLVERGRPDLVLALALVHHVVIGRTIPIVELIDWFASIGGELVIEFPDRDDVMVQHMLRRKREGTHVDYERSVFEDLLRSRFEILRSIELPSGTRTLYHAAQGR